MAQADVLTEEEIANYTKLNIESLASFEEKITALLAGDIVLLRDFEDRSNRDVIIRLEENRFTLLKGSTDIIEPEDGRFWIRMNIGFNQVSLGNAFLFKEGTYNYDNRFTIDDIVYYETPDGHRDTAIVESVYVDRNASPHQFAYTLSLQPDSELYREESLTPILNVSDSPS